MKSKKALSFVFLVLPIVLVTAVLSWGMVVGASSVAVPAHHDADMLTNVSADAVKFAIHGRVTHQAGISPTSWRVQALRPDGKVADEMVIGADGFYQLRPLSPAIYELQVVDEYDHILSLSPGSQNRIWPDAGSLADEYLLIVEADTPDMTAVFIQGSGQITGVVTAEDTGLPLSSIYVVAYSLDGGYQDGDFTDSQGRYDLIDLAAGQYKVRFQEYFGSVYATEWYDNQPNFDSATPVAVSEGGTTANINVALDIGGQITGQITAADTSLPLEDVRVVVYDSADDYVDIVYANTAGVYTVTQLANTAYRLKFEPHGTANLYLTEYYNDKPTLAAADPVPVALGQTVTGIDAVLTRGGTIQGTVTDATTGAPLADVVVSAYIDSAGSGCAGDFVFLASATTDAAGNYTLTKLPTGDYRLRFQPSSNGASAAYLSEYYHDKANLDLADIIHVTVPEVVDNINAGLARGGQIMGMVTAVDTSLPLANVRISVYDSNNWFVTSATTNASGMYTVTALVAGDYRLLFAPSSSGVASTYQREYYNDKPDLAAADAIPVPAAATISNINAALARGGQITGQVTAADTGLPLDDVSVSIYGSSGAFFGSVPVNSSGVYTTTGLATGSYRLRFSPSSFGDAADYMTEHYNDKPDLATANPVNVTAPSLVTGIDAALARGGKITGRVTATGTGAPVEDVRVYAYDADGRYVTYDYTDASGDYAITGLSSGGYRLYFYKAFPIYQGCSVSYYVVSEYYDDKPDLASGDVIQVVAPNIVGGIDAVMSVPNGPFDKHVYLPAVLR
jgi:hypothetical protein